MRAGTQQRLDGVTAAPAWHVPTGVGRTAGALGPVGVWPGRAHRDGQQVVRTLDEAVASAETIGFPVALKAVTDKIVHKSDAGPLPRAARIGARPVGGVPGAASRASESPLGRVRMGIGGGLYTSTRPFDTLEDIGRRHGFPVVSLLALFREREATQAPLFRQDDMHHTVAGAAVFGEGVFRGLVSRELVPCAARGPA